MLLLYTETFIRQSLKEFVQLTSEGISTALTQMTVNHVMSVTSSTAKCQGVISVRPQFLDVRTVVKMATHVINAHLDIF